MQVVQPYPYQVEPQLLQIGGEFGAVEVVGHHFGSRRQRGFTQGLLRSPFLTAFFASRPAAIITLGLEVLVQEVIAAITTAPSRSSCCCPSSVKVLLSVSALCPRYPARWQP